MKQNDPKKRKMKIKKETKGLPAQRDFALMHNAQLHDKTDRFISIRSKSEIFLKKKNTAMPRRVTVNSS